MRFVCFQDRHFMFRKMKEPSYIQFPINDARKKRNSSQATKILCNIFIVVFAFFLGVVSYWYVNLDSFNFYDELKKRNEPVCSKIPDIEKLDCYPDSPVTENECLKRGCCFNSAINLNATQHTYFPPLNVPYCFYPSDYVGYKIESVVVNDKQCIATLKRVIPSGFPKDVENLLLVITFINDYSLRIKITDADSSRFEVPIPLYYKIKSRENQLYDVHIDTFGNLAITRKSSGSMLFKTNLSRLVYSDQLLQISSSLPSPYLYGIGEHYDNSLRSMNWTRFTLFNSDRAPIPKKPLYGSHPFYMVVEPDGSSNGVFLLNSNSMDVILQPSPAITFRPIGGILDFFVMLGPSPKDVIQQYSDIIGHTFMPPYWSLGFHLCRYGYNSLNKTREVWKRNVDAGIPLDVQWNDIDYMDKYKDFTYDKVNFQGLPEFVNELHDKGMHYVAMTDPGISSAETPGSYPPYDEGVKEDIFIKDASGKIFEGKVWTGGPTVFPDFSHPSAEAYWEKQFLSFYSEVKFDGIWIDMNEPSNFFNGAAHGCPKSSLEDPTYVPGGDALRTKTLCMTAKHYSTVHYNEHNLYGYREAKATNRALQNIRQKRPFIISRASFSGQGVHSGHWSGDISSTWEDMRYTIPSMLNFNLYGMPMIGSDICGFNSNTTVELCARWQALGAFYPFSRNHNERITIEQDPVALGPTVVNATKTALNYRYYLLPYLYTLFYRSHVYGETVARPLFFEFVNDKNAYDVDEQFLWGPALMIMPALYPGVDSVHAYLPKGLWYNFTNGEVFKSSGESFHFFAPITSINLAIRGGYVLPLQMPALTTTQSRQNPFDLYVALNENKEAVGELYWDDGDSLDTYENGKYNLIQFTSKENNFTSAVIKQGYQTSMILNKIIICGLDKVPNKVTINGLKVFFEYKNCLTILTTRYNLLTPLMVIWT